MTHCLKCGRPLDLPAYLASTPIVGRCCLDTEAPDYEQARWEMGAIKSPMQIDNAARAARREGER